MRGLYYIVFYVIEKNAFKAEVKFSALSQELLNTYTLIGT